MLKTEHSTGSVDIEETAFFFFGPPKIGKSTLASGFEKAYFLVTSRKEVKKLKVPFTLIDSWEATLEATKELLKSPTYKKKYDFLVVDFVDQAYLNCTAKTCKDLKIKHVSEAGYGKGVDMVDFEFKQWINSLIASEYGIIFISHVQTKEVIKQGGSFTKTTCTLPDRARKIILPLVSVIGYIDFVSQKTTTEDGKTKYRQKRVISFEPSEWLEAGDRDGYLPASMVLPDNPSECYELFKSYYTGKKSKTKKKVLT